ncbi:dihydrofolate reductase family protein [Cellulomonas carbonis]|uniref:Deaminase/reductase n=1 Tax=Cellulomonas carbonis T26 TaxID=947969 RepID=A0A0A0BXW1_9CELL|nr:dihydrofolate reductase family protein [Cellulomonas carbonis]KGM12547.1 deaminase/reductase [Cellulomonas carbonis T26]GGB93548.1 hypothetical protein GCM10010972_02770 [Cellulomonas carbonis]
MDASPALDVLLPADRAGRIEPDDAEAALRALYAYPDEPWVRANMVTTLDGAAAGPDGRTGSINGPPDHRVFQVLRALSDVVLVGAGTVRAEGYRAPRTPPALRAARDEAGQGPDPELAVVTGRGDLPAALLDDRPTPWVFTTSDAPFLGHLRAHLPVDRLHVADGPLDVGRVVRTLVDAGRRRVLTEGGPQLLGALLAEGLVDELCLTQSPVVTGGGPPLVAAGGTPRLAHAAPAHLLHADGFLVGRWVLARG